MRIDFDFAELEAFLAVAELGSFQRAAKKLNISQSAITRRIQRLEEALETTLFERTTRSLKLTLQAKSFRVRAQSILDDAAESVRMLRDETFRYEFQKNAIVTIATISTLTHRLLPQVIKEFRDQGYTAKIRILDLFANDVIESVSNGEADFGVGFTGIEESGLAVENLFEDPFELVMSRDHPLARRKSIQWNELIELPLILPLKGTGNRFLIDIEMARSHHQLKWEYQVRHSSTALSLVEAGVGVAVLPGSALPRHKDAAVISKKLTHPSVSRMVGTVRRTNHTLSQVADAFYQILCDICKQETQSAKHH